MQFKSTFNYSLNALRQCFARMPWGSNVPTLPKITVTIFWTHSTNNNTTIIQHSGIELNSSPISSSITESCWLELWRSCFSHGQFYIGCSRVGHPNNLFTYAPEGKTKTIIYKAALTITTFLLQSPLRCQTVSIRNQTS